LTLATLGTQDTGRRQ